jgi:hypothetical protein
VVGNIVETAGIAVAIAIISMIETDVGIRKCTYTRKRIQNAKAQRKHMETALQHFSNTVAKASHIYPEKQKKTLVLFQ